MRLLPEMIAVAGFIRTGRGYRAVDALTWCT
jgi:hypothetical protein